MNWNGMNRLRFLDLLRSVTVNRPQTQSLSGSSKAMRNELRLRIESLEERRVLAAAVTEFTPTDSGFVVEFSEAVDSSKLNLFDSEGGAMGAADVTLSGASTGAINGSLVVDGTTLIFLASGGPLAADTYTVTLRSAENGITSQADSSLLDGEFSGSFPSGNGTAGGNFVTTFTVGTSAGLVVGLPDFARGPGQTVQAPASGSATELPDGLVVQLSNAAGVTSITMTIEYDPSLLDVTDVQLGADAPAGSQVESNLTVPGTISLSFFALAPLAAADTNLIELIATVPEAAPYGSAHVLQITSLDVNAGALAARADDSLHVVAFAGDVNANRRYDAEDARLIARVGVGLDSGFVSTTPTSSTITTPLYPTIDPAVLSDVTGNGEISPLDASDVLRKIIGLSVPNLPDLPSAQAPLALSLSNQTLSGNQASGTTVGTFTTSDPDVGDTFTYSLVSGTGDTNNSSFTLSGNSLVTAAPLTTTQGNYSIRVRTTDSTGRSFERNFVISVNESNVAPTAIALSSSTLAESSAIGTTIATLSTTDANAGDTFTYSLVSGTGSTDNSAFTIVGNQLRLNTAVDFETKASYSVRLRTTDSGGLTFEQSFTLTVTNVNEAPTAIDISATNVAADAASGVTVGNLSTVDPDAGDTHIYTLVSGTGSTDNALFAISGSQLQTAADFDALTQTSYSIRVRSTDAAGLTFERIITGSIVDGNLAPTGIALSSSTMAENLALGSVIATLSSTDPNTGDTFTYSLVAGTGDTDNGAFTVSANQLLLNAAVDFETQSSYSIRLRTADAEGLTFEQAFTLTVTNVNEAPTAIDISATNVAADAASGVTVGNLSTVDPDAGDTHTYTLVSGDGSTDNALFAISGNQLQTATNFDALTQTTYSIRVRSTDAAGLTFERIITGSIVDGNSAPTGIALSSSTMAENLALGSVIATLSSSDPNAGDTFTYSLVEGTGDTDNSAFTVSSNQLLLNAAVDFETQSSFSIRLRTTDAEGLAFEQSFTLTVTNVNEAPTAIDISATDVAADAASGVTIGNLSTVDPDADDTHTYTLVSGDGSTDNALFAISGNQLQTATDFDALTQTTYSIRVRSTDADGLTFERIITGTIVDGNLAPTEIVLSSSTVVENLALGSVIATLSSTDPNSGDTFTYSLVEGTGDTDNGAFTVSANQLLLNAAVDFETKSSYSIRLRTTDAEGLTFEQAFTLTVTDINETPTAISLSSTDVIANVVVGQVVGELSASDPDASETHTFALVAGDGDTDNALFSIVGNELRTAAVFDTAIQESYSIRVRVTDLGGEIFEQVLTGAVIDDNLAPTSIDISNSSLPELSAIGTLVGTLTTTDPNVIDFHLYSLVAGDGDSDNSSFTITDDELLTNSELDFETQSSYSIRVRSTDAVGLFVEEVLTISVTDVNEAPTAIGLSSSSVTDGDPIGTIVGDITASDPDADDDFVYELVAGAGDDDNASFTITGSQLVTGFLADLAMASSYSVRVRATDLGGLTFEQTLTITVVEANVAPSAIALSSSNVDEDAAVGTTIGTLSSTDANLADTHTYTLVTGDGDTDNASFEIDGNAIQTASAFDFETKSSYSVRVRSTDAGGLFVEETFVITVVDTNDAPTEISLSNISIPEDATVGTTVGSLSTVDQDSLDSHSYALVAGTGDDDNALFAVVGNELRTASLFDFESQSSFSIRLQSTDSGGLLHERVFMLSVTDVNEAATTITLDSNTVTDGDATGTLVGLLAANDPDIDDELTFSLVSGSGDTDNSAFSISNNQLLTTFTADLDAQSSYSIRVRVTDQGGLFHEEELTVTVIEQPVAPTSISLSNSSIAEDAAIGAVVGDFTTADDNVGDLHTYTLVSGTGDTDNDSFAIVDDQLVTATALDFETKDSYSIRVRTTDSAGLTFEQTFTIEVTDVNEAPTAVDLSKYTIADLENSGAVVGIIGTTDPDALDTFIYTLTAGTGDDDNGSFQIVSGQLVMAASVDAAVQDMYSVRVRSEDSGGLAIEQILEILVSEANTAPTAIAIDLDTISESAAIGTVVGLLSTTDSNALDTHVYSLVVGTGDTDNAMFTIVGNELRLASVLDFDTQSSLSIRVRSVDPYGLSVEEVLTITVLESI